MKHALLRNLLSFIVIGGPLFIVAMLNLQEIKNAIPAALLKTALYGQTLVRRVLVQVPAQQADDLTKHFGDVGKLLLRLDSLTGMSLRETQGGSGRSGEHYGEKDCERIDFFVSTGPMPAHDLRCNSK